MFKKMLSMLLVMAMLLGMMPTVFAAEAEPKADINVTLRVIGSSLPDGKPSLSSSKADYKGAEYQNWMKTTAFTTAADTPLYTFLETALKAAGLSCTMASATTKISVTAPKVFGGHELKYDTTAYGSSAKWAVTILKSDGTIRKENNSSFTFAVEDGDQIVLRWAWSFNYEKSGKAWESNTWAVADISPAEYGAASTAVELINAIGRVTPNSKAAIDAARAAYDAVPESVKSYVTNYETLTAAEATFKTIENNAATRVPLPAPTISAGTAGFYTYAPNAAIEGVEAEKYTMVYRVSLDGEKWGAWQPAIEKLLPMRTYYIQGMALTNDWATYGDSAVSNVIQVTTAGEENKVVTEVTDKDTLMAALQAVAADGKLYIIDFKKNVVIDDITGEHFRHDLPAGSNVLLTSSNGSKYYFNEPGNYSFIGVSAGTTVTVRDLYIATIAGSSSLLPVNEQQKVFAFIEHGGVVNFENITAFTTSTGPLVGYNPYSNGTWTGTVNIYSGVMNATLDSSILSLAAGSVVNLIPTGNIMMEGKLGKVTSVNILDLLGVSVRTAVETKDFTTFTKIDTATMTTTMQYSCGLRVIVTEGVTVPPVAQGNIVILPADDANAANADVTYVIHDNDISFTYKDRKNAMYQIKFNKWNNNSDYFYTRGDDLTPDDKTDDNGALNHTRTYTGLTQDTEYSFTIRFSSLNASFTDVETTITLKTTYTPVAMDAPTLSDECQKTESSITVTAPAASAQDTTAVVLYRIRKAGTEGWGAWQESLSFTGLEGYTDYEIQAMYQAKHYLWLDSAESNTVTIKTKAPQMEAPKLDAENVTATFDSVTVPVPGASAEDPNAEIWYRIGTLKDTVGLLQTTAVTEEQIAWNDWQQSNVFTGLEADTTYYVQAYYVTEMAQWQNSRFSQILEVKTATNESAPHFKVESAAGKAGSEVKVYISIHNNPGIITAYLNIGYDNTKLQLKGYEDLKLLPDGSFSALDANPFKAQWDGALLPDNLTANGKILVLTFQILEGCQVGDEIDVTLTYNENEVYDFNMQNVKFAVINGSVTVTSHIWGEATYTWNDDHSECTATHSCTCCDAPVTETETVSTTVETVAPTETQKGSTTYTAAFTKAGFTTQTYVKMIPATGTFLEVGKAEGCVGTTVKVPVNIIQNPGIVGAELILAYDADKLTFVGAENGQILGEMLINAAYGDGLLYISWSDALSEGSSEDGVVLTLTFTIRDNCQIGETEVKIHSFKAHDTNLDEQTFNLTHGGITVKDHSWSQWTYTWNDANTACTAKRTQACGCGQVQTQTVKSVIVSQNCTKLVYRAHFTNGAEDQILEAEIQDHDYTVSGNENGSQITYTCTQCAHSYTEELSAGSGRFVISNAAGKKGDRVQIDVSIVNNPGFTMAQLKVDYNNTMLRLVEVKNGKLFETVTRQGDVITLGSKNEIGDATADGIAFTLVFEILAEGEQNIGIGLQYVNGDITNYNGNAVFFGIDNGIVTVYSYILGDVNRDGVVDIKDVTVLRRYLAGTVAGSDVDLLAADCNGDGVVDIKDVTILRRYLAGTAELGK